MNDLKNIEKEPVMAVELNVTLKGVPYVVKIDSYVHGGSIEIGKMIDSAKSQIIGIINNSGKMYGQP